MDYNFESLNQVHNNPSFNNTSKKDDSNQNSFQSNAQYSKSQLNYQEINNEQEIHKKSFQIVNDAQNSNILNLIASKTNNQINQDQKRVEITDFDFINQDTYTNKAQKEEQFKDQVEQQQNKVEEQQTAESQYVGVIFENKSSIVDLILENSLNKFVVTKENIGEKKLFEKEYKVLEQLKGHNISLDIVSVMKDDYKFQQIAGKTSLYLLKQKTQDTNIFEKFYFVLLDKLNKMHELGIAHSDIKPQNIVISYDDEPFFIDFGSSISLNDKNDYKNYLNQFTSSYNLKIYFDIFDPEQRIFKHKQFKTKEEIQLCDQTQLCLTFLYLLCNDQIQLGLFKTKNYNQLIQNLYDNIPVNIFSIDQKKNRIIVLSNISRILNQADPQINIIKDVNGYLFSFDENNISYELSKLNDIYFEKGKYKVQYVNKYSILLIYFLDKQDYKLYIDPKNINITPLPKMKEYQFISQKYKLNNYFQSLVSDVDFFDGRQLYNIVEYINAYQPKRISLKFQDDGNFEKLFMTISNLKCKDTFELKIQFNKQVFDYFNNSLQQNLSNLQAQSFQIFEDRIICIVRKQINKNLQINDVNVKVHLTYFNNYINRDLETLKKCYKIKQLDISFQSIYHNNLLDMIVIKTMQAIEEQLEEKNHEQIFSQYIEDFRQFNQHQILNLLDYKEQYDYLEDLNIQDFKYYEHRINTIEDINDFRLKHLQKSDAICLECEKNLSKIKQAISEQIEKFTCQFQKDNQITQKILIHDFTFQQTEVLLKIKDIIEQKYNFYIEMKIINCLFSEQFAQLLKDLCLEYYNEVKYEFKNEYNEQNEQNENEKDYSQFQLHFEYNQQQLNEKGLKIIIFNQFLNKQQQTEQNEQNNKNETICYNIFENFLKELCVGQNNYIGKQSNNHIQKIFSQEKQFQTELQELNMQFEEQTDQQKFQFVNKEIELQNINDIDLIIQDIKNNIQYTKISMANKMKQYQYFDFDISLFHNQLYITCESEDIDLLNKFYELLKTISENHNKYQINSNDQKQLFNHINIEQQINYSSYQIRQTIKGKNHDYKFQEILSFFGQNINQNSDYTKKSGEFNFQLIGYRIDSYDQYYQNGYFIDDFSEMFKNRKLNEDFNHFQKHSILNSELKADIFSNKLQISQFEFSKKKMGDNCFKYFFEELEKVFQQNKSYNLKGCNLTAQTLYNINQIIKMQQIEKQIYFNLKNNNITYNDLKQFINEIKQDDLKYYQFIFKSKFNIVAVRNSIKSQLMNDFPDILQADDNGQYLMIQKDQTSLAQKESKKVIIQLRFIQADESEQLSSFKPTNFFVDEFNKIFNKEYQDLNENEQTDEKEQLSSNKQTNKLEDEINKFFNIGSWGFNENKQKHNTKSQQQINYDKAEEKYEQIELENNFFDEIFGQIKEQKQPGDNLFYNIHELLNVGQETNQNIQFENKQQTQFEQIIEKYEQKENVIQESQLLKERIKQNNQNVKIESQLFLNYSQLKEYIEFNN